MILARILARLGLSALVFSALGLAGPAARAEPGVSFTLDYTVPPRCPARSEFVAALLARSKLARPASGSAEVAIAVELEPSGDRVAGALRLRLRDGQTSERAIPESSCGEAITSMAVIAAMVIDGGSLDAPVPARTDEPQAPTPPSTVRSTAKRGRPAPSVRRAPAPGVRRAPARERAPSTSTPLPFRFGAAISGVYESAIAPEWIFGADVGVELAWRQRGWFAPSVRATLGFAESGFERVESVGRARYRSIKTSWSGCPLRFRWTPSITLRPCAVVEVGDLQATGSSSAGEQEDNMFWLGFGAAGRAELGVAQWLALELEGRAIALARHDRFVFRAEPAVIVHDVPRLAAGVRLGVIVRLP